nr:hypothetical protein [Tanacetum cinerariifolium]
DYPNCEVSQIVIHNSSHPQLQLGIQHGDVCLSWGMWGEFVGGRGSGGDGLESRGSGSMGDGGKIGLAV